MKKLLLLCVVAISATSCFTTYSYSEIERVGDFRRYAVNDFVVSSVSTGYKYTPVAEVAIDFNVGAHDVNVAKAMVKKYNITDVGYVDSNDHFHPSYDYMLALLVNKAKELGATGILNFKIVSNRSVTQYTSLITSYTASGFAIEVLGKQE